MFQKKKKNRVHKTNEKGKKGDICKLFRMSGSQLMLFQISGWLPGSDFSHVQKSYY